MRGIATTMDLVSNRIVKLSIEIEGLKYVKGFELSDFDLDDNEDFFLEELRNKFDQLARAGFRTVCQHFKIGIPGNPDFDKRLEKLSKMKGLNE